MNTFLLPVFSLGIITFFVWGMIYRNRIAEIRDGAYAVAEVSLVEKYYCVHTSARAHYSEYFVILEDSHGNKGRFKVSESSYYTFYIGSNILLVKRSQGKLFYNAMEPVAIRVPERFSPYHTHYLLTVADWVSRVTFTPTAYDANAVITVNGQVVRSGQTSQVTNMTDEPQAVNISVRSGNATTTYTIYLQRRPSEKRTRVSAGYITNIYTKNNDWRLVADLGTISYLSDDYSTGSRSNFENKTADSYDYVVSPNCLFYYGTPTNPIRLNTVSEFMTYYRVYGSNLYTIIYIEDEIVAVFPYGAEQMIY